MAVKTKNPDRGVINFEEAAEKLGKLKAEAEQLGDYVNLYIKARQAGKTVSYDFEREWLINEIAKILMVLPLDYPDSLYDVLCERIEQYAKDTMIRNKTQNYATLCKTIQD